jgi:HCOMODA/2-hydroxy-3-carboxy-muconic semialdehyde decarboxylase
MRTPAYSDMHGYAQTVADRPGGGASGPSQALIEELALANRILFREGVVDAFGHVSVRSDADPSRYLLARNMAPALVTADDIVEFDLDSAPLNADGRAVYLERFIHGEIYKARPDVTAVVHSHSPAVVPFGIVKTAKFRSVCHMSSFLPVCTPIFEIRDTAGEDNDLLITSHALGAALARVLGEGTCVLMRGHGSTVVASNLREVVYRAVYTEVNAKLQSEAMRMGEVTYLNEKELVTTTRTIATQINRAWDFWRMRAEGKL